MNEETAATVAEPGAHVALEKASSKKGASKKKGAPKGQKSAKGGKTKRQAKAVSKTASKPAAKKEPVAVREGSKTATVLELLGRKNGATLAELAKATKWQNHSIRGFISGTLGKKMGLTIESTKTEAGERLYKISH